jgi:nicotinamidase-related amidase
MAIDLAPLLPSGRVALLLSEVQRGIIGDLGAGRPLAAAAQDAGVIAQSARLAQAARARQAPVVHCLANTTPGRFGAGTNCRLYTGIGRAPSQERPPHDPAADLPCPEVWCEGDILSPRDQGLSPMADSQLDRRLRNRSISTVVLAGVSLNVALIGLAIEAVNCNYQVILARDAVAGFPADYAEPVIRNTFAFITTLATVDEIVAAWPQA